MHSKTQLVKNIEFKLVFIYNISKQGGFSTMAKRCRVNENCIGCGACEATCPDAFELVDGVAQFKHAEVPADLEEAVQEAADGCPVQAIEVE